jgi:hypothetical protein
MSASAILQGSAVGAGGAVVMTTLIGVAAVVGMNLQGLSPETMRATLEHGIAFRGFVVAAEWITAVAGGYAAVRVAACRRQTAHAFSAAGGTIVLKCMTWLLLGNPWPLGLAAIDLAIVVPCALVGGYLAAPCPPLSSEAPRPSASSLK